METKTEIIESADNDLAGELESITEESGTSELLRPDVELEPEETNQGEATGRARSEAAKYRTRLREVESERDSLQKRLEGTQISVATEVMDSARLSLPAETIIRLGLTPLDYFNEDGELDRKSLVDAAQKVLDDTGITALIARRNPMTNRPKPNLLRGGSTPDKPVESPSWGKAIRGDY